MKRAYHLRLYGDITNASYINLRLVLKKRLLTPPAAVAVSVNSFGGSVVSAKNIARYLRGFCEDNELPLLTFADDISYGAANIVLASGHKVFANPYSNIGDFGVAIPHLSVQGFLKKYDIDILSIKEGSQKDRLTMYRDLNDSDRELLHKIALARENELRQEILNLRLKAFKKRRLDVEQVSNKLFDASNKLEDFKQLGLVDEIATLDEILARDHDGVKRIILNVNSSFGVAGKLETHFN